MAATRIDLDMPALEDTERLGRALARALRSAPLSVRGPVPEPTPGPTLGTAPGSTLGSVPTSTLVIYLEGELGAGKTTLTRAVLASLGHHGRVPSPTYTLVEQYVLDGIRLVHADLYRLKDPSELEHVGLVDEIGEATILMIEWPERGVGRLPPPDLRISLAIAPSGRGAGIEALSPAGQRVLDRLEIPSTIR